MVGLTIFKKDKEYIIADNDDLPVTRRQLSILLNKCCAVEIHEIAFMFEEFKRNQHHTRAYFGMNGYFLFTD